MVLQFVVVMAMPPVNADDVALLFGSDVLQLGFDFSNNLFLFNISILVESDEGVYTLVATTAAGSGNASIFLDIQREFVVHVMILLNYDNSSDKCSIHCVFFIHCALGPPSSTVVPDRLSVVAGVRVMFECLVLAEPSFTVEWLFNDMVLATGGRFDLTNPVSLVITNISLSDTGQYSCNSSNVHGFDIAVAVLTVQGMASASSKGT